MTPLLLAAVLLTLLAAPALAQTVTEVETNGTVTAVVQTPRGTYIETTRGTFRVTDCLCDDLVSITPDVIRGLPEPAPDGALPDGTIATASRGDIRKAWYSRPTERYAHCVLGDCIEAGSLVVETATGAVHDYVLPDAQVFEDITPRLHDFGNDGTNEIVTIRSSQSGGAGVVVYGLRGGALVEIAASSENGRPNRWLNIALVTQRWPFITPKGKKAVPSHHIFFVRTPHIGGKLSELTYKDGTWRERNRIMRDVSNHLIGSRVLDMTAMASEKSGPSFFLPSQDRRTLRAIPGFSTHDDIALPGPIDKPIVTLGNKLLTATEDGRLVVISF